MLNLTARFFCCKHFWEQIQSPVVESLINGDGGDDDDDDDDDDGGGGGGLRLYNQEIMKQYRDMDVVTHINLRRLEWAGHINRMENQRIPWKIIEGRMYDKRPIRRPKDRWADAVTVDARQVLGVMAWKRTSLDRSSWKRRIEESELRKNVVETDEEEKKELAGSLAEKKLLTEGCTRRNSEKRKSSGQKKIDDINIYSVRRLRGKQKMGKIGESWSLPSKETLRGHSDSSFRGEGYIQCCVGVRLCDMYSNQELAEIHFTYGKADGNAALARRLYQERYPQRQCPDYLWGHLKSLVYSYPVPDLESLRNRIVACSEDIRNTPGVWDRVRSSMRHRCEVCIQAGGGHFEHLL
ncbi:hypothetical protein ANN_19653 [Periplaneta americana]|uniref:DUF4817 domain-containing protein n=1 Tax=Periplaneta americana TaxID=6978 RepID=A0ABQ8SB51_PERAM|nr:hypothetical protein ANN_19653 [Periplaneta americana]